MIFPYWIMINQWTNDHASFTWTPHPPPTPFGFPARIDLQGIGDFTTMAYPYPFQPAILIESMLTMFADILYLTHHLVCKLFYKQIIATAARAGSRCIPPLAHPSYINIVYIYIDRYYVYVILYDDGPSNYWIPCDDAIKGKDAIWKSPKRERERKIFSCIFSCILKIYL